MPDVLDLLHRSYGNSIYVILNGPASGQSQQGHKAGVAVMDTDSSSFAADNSDLLLLKGAASISSDYKIPLAREWQMDYDMSMDASDAYRFYNPFSIAKGIRMLGSTAGMAISVRFPRRFRRTQLESAIPFRSWWEMERLSVFWAEP